jgi:hypothetical protein
VILAVTQSQKLLEAASNTTTLHRQCGYVIVCKKRLNIVDDNHVRFVIQKLSHAINKTSHQHPPHATLHQNTEVGGVNTLLVLSPSFTASRTL